jgi:hypothetical protein
LFDKTANQTGAGTNPDETVVRGGGDLRGSDLNVCTQIKLVDY